jgi:hypothetical protein
MRILVMLLLDTLPSTSNDKVDRNVLPKPIEDLRPNLGVEYAYPSKNLEAFVVSIWQEVLHLKKVGVTDNFFDLGGTSLLVYVVQTKLQEKLNRHIPTVAFFEHPTIQKIVLYLDDDDYNFSFLQNRVRQKVSRRRFSHLQP